MVDANSDTGATMWWPNSIQAAPRGLGLQTNSEKSFHRHLIQHWVEHCLWIPSEICSGYQYYNTDPRWLGKPLPILSYTLWTSIMHHLFIIILKVLQDLSACIYNYMFFDFFFILLELNSCSLKLFKFISLIFHSISAKCTVNKLLLNLPCQFLHSVIRFIILACHRKTKSDNSIFV